jgi:hypothetical protein
MLVRFLSSETGELLMFAEVAGTLLRAIGKETAAKGSFQQDEMLAAAIVLRKAVERGEAAAAGAPAPETAEDGPPPVTLSNRAWPFIDMLERTSRGGAKANIVWEASAAF